MVTVFDDAKEDIRDFVCPTSLLLLLLLDTLELYWYSREAQEVY